MPSLSMSLWTRKMNEICKRLETRRIADEPEDNLMKAWTLNWTVVVEDVREIWAQEYSKICLDRVKFRIQHSPPRKVPSLAAPSFYDRRNDISSVLALRPHLHADFARRSTPLSPATAHPRPPRANRNPCSDPKAAASPRANPAIMPSMWLSDSQSAPPIARRAHQLTSVQRSASPLAPAVRASPSPPCAANRKRPGGFFLVGGALLFSTAPCSQWATSVPARAPALAHSLQVLFLVGLTLLIGTQRRSPSPGRQLKEHRAAPRRGRHRADPAALAADRLRRRAVRHRGPLRRLLEHQSPPSCARCRSVGPPAAAALDKIGGARRRAAEL